MPVVMCFCVVCREKFAASFAAVGSFVSLLLVLNFIPKQTKIQTVPDSNSMDINKHTTQLDTEGMLLQ